MSDAPASPPQDAPVGSRWRAPTGRLYAVTRNISGVVTLESYDAAPKVRLTKVVRVLLTDPAWSPVS